MNEAETRAELIDPQLKASGWGVVEDSKILRERDVCKITDGRIQVGGGRKNPLIADYILIYKGIKLAVVEAKSSDLVVGEGVVQAKLYAEKLNLNYTYSANGKEIYQINMKTGEEKLVVNFPTPDVLWHAMYSEQNKWLDAFSMVPFEDKSGAWKPRYYQEIAVNNTLEVIAKNQKRILLTLATGTGKTSIAFQIVWKLFHTRWNLNKDGQRQPRILFLADRNILADQAFNEFSAFADDAMVRIKPKEIKKRGKVPTNGSVFFTIFQSLMANDNTAELPENERQDEAEFDDEAAYYHQYAQDFFDLIIIDECHRGGANNESSWRGILEYFFPAVQLGLTATPKRQDNVDTYEYFGEPVYVYSLKEGIDDGFLTPFKVKRIQTTMDDYIYTNDDEILEGNVEIGKLYEEKDFNKNIEIKARESRRVQVFMDEVNQNEKTIVFCASQDHAAMVRDLINQYKKSVEVNYCVRVTANDGEIGEQFLRKFQNNERTIPTILTTSQKLSTGVDARNIRNIVLMREVSQMIEFKQIIGRGTRLFAGKDFFTIYDFVGAYRNFSDPEWDGEPIEAEVCYKCGESPCVCEKMPTKSCKECGQFPCICVKEVCETCGQSPCACVKKVKIRLADGKEREIQYMLTTSFWDVDGKLISAAEFLENLFGELPNFFKDEKELQEIWSYPKTREALLKKLDIAGFGKQPLNSLKKLINAENSDLFDVLKYVFDSDFQPMTRQERVSKAKAKILFSLNETQQEFIEFVLSKYIEIGVEELKQTQLPILLKIKYQSLEDAKATLGDIQEIVPLFVDFQKYLYQSRVA
ncbi:Type I restriction-modification system, restriction subunit R (EC 3.1.21.3) [uncultured Gammaproteobacteria bacterium]|jgi:type I restriction enzyme R subunit|nr:Type I restriction-modification system, restriction subunit R (EC 3.1.21.3) [uncultured Gammaproteobacteria bacterium]CAC9952155.1 Type I restriction-modification system, restriction subunit R (EC 3.1.21.3) [uncultured Gammaproteobacteria bacterium]